MAELVVENIKQLGAEGVRYMETIVTPFDSRDRNGNPIAPEVVDSIYRQRLSLAGCFSDWRKDCYWNA